MSANTRFKVTVLRVHEETIEVEAVTLWQAADAAQAQPGVISILACEYADIVETPNEPSRP